MECPTCGFNNMPGTPACIRCASPLNIATMTIDTSPPRAGAWQKHLRRRLPIVNTFRRLRNRAAELAPSTADLSDTARRAADPLFGLNNATIPAGVLFRALVPGWPQISAGQISRGRTFLYLFLAFFLITIPTFGTTIGSLFLGLGIAIHAASALDAVNSFLPEGDRAQIRNRWIVSLIALVLTVYLPAWWMISRVADASVIGTMISPLNPGDVVLINHWWPHIAPGSIVLYDIADFVEGEIHHGAARFGGQNINRILAVGPAHVAWDHGIFRVNGLPSPLQPLGPGNLPDVEMDVPDGEFFILPGGFTRFPGSSNGMHTLCCIARYQIEGTVYLRYQPLRRFGLIH
jgi:hypothetical protein